ncbi:Uncharacterised protein [Serratia fonticola]|nr:Uncharacterised protein [Serratia fonticola]
MLVCKKIDNLSKLDRSPLTGRGGCQSLLFGSKEVISVNLNVPIQGISPHFQLTRSVP